MAQHQVGALLPGEHGQVGRVALDGAQRHGQLGRAALRGGQRVRARVNHRDAVPEPGQRHREPAGPAAGVDDVEPGPAGLRGQRGNHGLQHVEDHHGARVVVPVHPVARHVPLRGPVIRVLCPPVPCLPVLRLPGLCLHGHPPRSPCSPNVVLINDNPGTHPPGGAGRTELCCPEPCLATNRVDSSGSW